MQKLENILWAFVLACLCVALVIAVLIMTGCSGSGTSGTSGPPSAEAWCDHADTCGGDSPYAPTHEQCVESVSAVPAACLACLANTSCAYYWGEGPSSCELCDACC